MISVYVDNKYVHISKSVDDFMQLHIWNTLTTQTIWEYNWNLPDCCLSNWYEYMKIIQTDW